MSDAYLIRSNLRRKARHALRFVGAWDGYAMIDSGYDIESVLTDAREDGVWPEDLYSSRIDFTKSVDVGRRMLLHLNTLVGHLRHEMMEKKIAFDSPKAMGKPWKEITDFIDSYFGPPGKTFTFANQAYTAKEFFKAPFFAPLYPEGFVSLNVERDPMAAYRALKAQLVTTGEPVRISMEWADAFVDHASGLISFEAFNPFETNHKFIRRLMKRRSDKYLSPHAVNIVDFAEDKDGKPIKFLVLNSWGDDVGDQGYYHVYWDYFQLMVKSVRVYEPFSAGDAKK